LSLYVYTASLERSKAFVTLLVALVRTLRCGRSGATFIGMALDQYNFRISKDLLSRIEAQAAKEQRTIAAQIRYMAVHYLDAALAAETRKAHADGTRR